MVVIGVVSTVLLVWMGNVKEEYLKKDVAEAQAGAAKANERAAEANRIAEEERLARVLIEESLSPRRLTEAQELDIGKSLRQFGPQKAQMVYGGGDREAQVFAVDIWRSLKRGGWQAFFPASLWSGVRFGREETLEPIGNARIDKGVEVFATESEVGDKAARRLAIELNKLGFDALVEKPTPARRDEDGMQVTVTTRPLGPQGIAKLRAQVKKHE